MAYVGHKSLKLIKGISENSSCTPFRGRSQSHLVYMTRWTHLNFSLDLLHDNRQGFWYIFVKIAISPQIRELWPKIGFWQVNN